MIEAGKLRELVGKTVLGRSGVRVGKITQVYESVDGQGSFATVRSGLFGTHSSFVPLAEAELHSDDVHVPYPKELIDEAPRVADEQELGAEEEDRLFAHYGLPGNTAAPEPATDDGEMTRSEERLHVGTERVETGRARLRKYVVTETVTQTVPVSHEELRVVREPLAPGAPGVPEVDALSEEVHEVVLSAERPVVQREVVAVERIRLETETVTGEEIVSEQVRKEQVELLDDLPPQEHATPPAPTQDVETVTRSELFIAPREDEPSEDRTTALPRASGGTEPAESTTSEFFIAPREDDPRP